MGQWVPCLRSLWPSGLLSLSQKPLRVFLRAFDTALEGFGKEPIDPSAKWAKVGMSFVVSLIMESVHVTSDRSEVD
jgi:hypothetical protein